MAVLVGNSIEERIYNFLIEEGYTPAGACGIMGNLYAESKCTPNNLENKYAIKFGKSDAEYTDMVDNKSYTKEQFVKDSAGYGLAQWTYHTRKRGLYEMTVENGLSIADLLGQLMYLAKELSGYKSLTQLLKSTDDVNVASDRVLTDFERPATLNYAQRRKYSQMFYDKYAPVYPGVCRFG